MRIARDLVPLCYATSCRTPSSLPSGRSGGPCGMPLLLGAAHPGLAYAFVAGEGKKWCGGSAPTTRSGQGAISTRRTIMASYNKVILMGNLVRDPELGSLPNNRNRDLRIHPRCQSAAEGQPQRDP